MKEDFKVEKVKILKENLKFSFSRTQELMFLSRLVLNFRTFENFWTWKFSETGLRGKGKSRSISSEVVLYCTVNLEVFRACYCKTCQKFVIERVKVSKIGRSVADLSSWDESTALSVNSNESDYLWRKLVLKHSSWSRELFDNFICRSRDHWMLNQFSLNVDWALLKIFVKIRS